jgi:hypothetical protein
LAALRSAFGPRSTAKAIMAQFDLFERDLAGLRAEDDRRLNER